MPVKARDKNKQASAENSIPPPFQRFYISFSRQCLQATEKLHRIHRIGMIGYAVTNAYFDMSKLWTINKEAAKYSELHYYTRKESHANLRITSQIFQTIPRLITPTKRP
jgi:hypothetical protein